MKAIFLFSLFIAFYCGNAIRVRRELRSLSKEEVYKVFDAMLIMKKLPTEEGKKLYGETYVNYDDLVQQHSDASSDLRCDQGHLGPAFAVFHRAFCLRFEQSLVAVDSTIQGAPYWDYNIEAKLSDPRKSEIWSDDFFGDSEGKAEDGYAIKNGYFSRNGWRIEKGTSPYGLHRAKWNNNPSSYVTRHSLACNTVTNLYTQFWGLCLNSPNYLLWYACIDPTVHTMAHSFIGGMWGNGLILPRPVCYADFAVGLPLNYNNKCITCPSGCLNDGSPCACSISNEARCVLDKATYNPVPTYGDFSDTWTSPNEPLFFFHHNNVDRHFSLWEKQHGSSVENAFNGFPDSSIPCYGHGLHDVLSSNNPFVNLFEKNGVHLTAFDILNNTIPANNLQYVYDTIYDVQERY